MEDDIFCSYCEVELNDETWKEQYQCPFRDDVTYCDKCLDGLED